MADREVFLSRIREATARGRAHRVAVNPQASAEAAYVGGGTDPVETLLAEWQAVGGKGERLSNRTELASYLAGYLSPRKVRTAIRWSHPVLEKLRIDELLAELQVVVTPWDELACLSDEERWAPAFAADLGIASVTWAIAETGSLLMGSSPSQGRVVSLLPPMFLAILEPSQIVPDLFDAFARLESSKTQLPSNLAFITGPSKTGDIELKLVTGVHGPGDVTLLVLESSEDLDS